MIFQRVRYCYYIVIVDVGSPGSPALLYYIIIFLLGDVLGVVAKSDDALEDFSYNMLRKKHLKLSHELISLENT